MRIRVIAVGRRMDEWVERACDEYRRRLPREWRFELATVAAARRPSGGVARARDDEGRRMLARVGERGWVVALDERGEPWSTRELAARLGDWMREGDTVNFLIGGADGLSGACRDRAGRTWSLSALTLPHGLARVIVVEQLYRAWTVLNGHPYHRA